MTLQTLFSSKSTEGSERAIQTVQEILIKCSENPLNMHERDLNFNYVVCIIMPCTWVVMGFRWAYRIDSR